MRDKIETKRRRKRYSMISVQKRIKLIDLVLQQGIDLTKAAKMLRIKRPTAKIIVKRYQRKGTFFQKQMPKIIKKMIKQIETSVNNDVEPSILKEQYNYVQKEVPVVQPTPCLEGQFNYFLYYPQFVDYRYFI